MPQSMGSQRAGRDLVTQQQYNSIFYICIYKCVFMCAQLLRCVLLLVTPWTVSYQSSLSVGFFREEYRCGLPFPPPGDLPDPGANLCLLHW